MVKNDKWIAIGDIHSSPKQLNELLKKCAIYPAHKLVFLGDYVDCGPDAHEAVSILRGLPADPVFLLGNHDDELIRQYGQIKRDYDKTARLCSYKNITAEDILWLEKNTVLSFETESAFFSHAGVDDLLSLDEQPREALLWSSPREELDHVTDKLVVQGHFPLDFPQNFGNHWFVDTGCGRGGKLSALVYPEMEILQSGTASGDCLAEW